MNYLYMAEQLNGDYRDVFEKTELYGMVKQVNSDVQDDLMMNLFDLLLTAQANNKPIQKVVGPDVEKFCRDYFQNYNIRERMKIFPARLYQFMRFIFIFELLTFFLMDEHVDLAHAHSDLTPYLFGVGCSLLLTMIADVFVRPLIFRFRIKPILYYIGLLIFFIALIVIGSILTDGMMLYIPMFLILLVSGIYVAIYLVLRSVWRYQHGEKIFLPKKSTEDFDQFNKNKTLEQVMLDSIVKEYKRKNRRLEKKGEQGLTPGDFTETVRADYKRATHSWKWMLLVFSLIIALAIVQTALTSTIPDTILFTVVLLFIEGAIYWFLLRSAQNNNQIRKEILDTCDAEGISVIEYAMRHKKNPNQRH